MEARAASLGRINVVEQTGCGLWLTNRSCVGVLAIIKVVSAIHPIIKNQHYTPHTPNGAMTGNGKIQAA